LRLSCKVCHLTPLRGHGGMIDSLAEMERELTVERTRAGLEVAPTLERVGGRKRKMTDSKLESARRLLAGGVPTKGVAKNLGVGADAVSVASGFFLRGDGIK
jgi:DNA invertase Pin-like site-specific DNA recombinase